MVWKEQKGRKHKRYTAAESSALRALLSSQQAKASPTENTKSVPTGRATNPVIPPSTIIAPTNVVTTGLATNPAASPTPNFPSSSYTPPAAVQVPTATPTSISNATTTPALSQGALYGIIGGSAGGGIILLILIGFCCWKKRKAKKEEGSYWNLKEEGKGGNIGNENFQNGQFGTGQSYQPYAPDYQSNSIEKQQWSPPPQQQQQQPQAFTPTNPNFQFNRTQPISNTPPPQQLYPPPPQFNPRPSYGDLERRNAEAAASRAELFNLSNNRQEFREVERDYDSPRVAPIPNSHKALPPTRPAYRPSEVPKGVNRYLNDQQVPPLPIHTTRAPSPPPPVFAIEDEEGEGEEGSNFMDVMLSSNRDTLTEEPSMAARSNRRQSMGRSRDVVNNDQSFGAAQEAWAEMHAKNSIPTERMPSIIPLPSSPKQSKVVSKPIRSSSRRVRPPMPSAILPPIPPSPPTNLAAVNEVIVPNTSKMVVSESYEEEEELQEGDLGRIDSRPLRDLEDMMDTFNSRGEVIRSASNASNGRDFGRSDSNTSEILRTPITQPLKFKSSPNKSKSIRKPAPILESDSENDLPSLSYEHSITSSKNSPETTNYHDQNYLDPTQFGPLGGGRYSHHVNNKGNDRSVTESIYGSYNQSYDDLHDMI